MIIFKYGPHTKNVRSVIYITAKFAVKSLLSI